jgi:ABC-type glycerol-3-phosphate transport system substrate-binding protein
MTPVCEQEIPETPKATGTPGFAKSAAPWGKASSTAMILAAGADYMQRECGFRLKTRAMLGQLALWALIMVAGCNSPAAPTLMPKLHAGATLHVAAPPDQAVRELLARHGNAWSELSGGHLEIVPADAEADVRIFRPADLPRLAHDGRIGPVPESIKSRPGFDFAGILGTQRLHLDEWQRKIYALPIVGESALCVYRADLLESTQHATALERRLKKHPLRSGGPVTWQEFAAIAEYFAATTKWSDQDASPALSNGRRTSLPPLPDAPDELDRQFHLVAASFVREAMKEEKLKGEKDERRRRLLYDYFFDVTNGDARIGDPGFAAALTLLVEMQPCRCTDHSASLAELFQSGRAMMAVVPLSEIPALRRLENQGPIRLGVCRVPGSAVVYDRERRIPIGDPDGNYVPYLGGAGWLAGLAPGAGESALDLITYLSGPTTSLEIAFESSWGGGPTRQNHLDLANRSGWYGYDLSEAQTNRMLVALADTVNPTLADPIYCLRIPDQKEYQKMLAEELRAALAGTKTTEAALADAARRWNEFGGAAGKEQRKADYMLGLGLN